MKNIIFDWSGVVRDAVASQLWVVNAIFERYGVGTISLEELRENWEQPYTRFYQKYLPQGYKESEQTKMYRAAALGTSCPSPLKIPEMVELIRRLKGKGAFLAVVSSDLPETLLAELKEWQLENVFQVIITEADDKLGAVEKIIND